MSHLSLKVYIYFDSFHGGYKTYSPHCHPKIVYSPQKLLSPPFGCFRIKKPPNAASSSSLFNIYIYIYSAIQFQSCCCASPHKIDVLVANVLHRLLPLMLIVNFCSIHILCVLLCCSDSRSRILFIFFVHFVRYSLITLVCYSIPRSIRQSNTIHSGHFRQKRKCLLLFAFCSVHFSWETKIRRRIFQAPSEQQLQFNFTQYIACMHKSNLNMQIYFFSLIHLFVLFCSAPFSTFDVV